MINQMIVHGRSRKPLHILLLALRNIWNPDITCGYLVQCVLRKEVNAILKKTGKG